jgi:hypothetical protein
MRRSSISFPCRYWLALPPPQLPFICRCPRCLAFAADSCPASMQEREFCQGYADMMREHLFDCFLQHLPAGDLHDISKPNMIPQVVHLCDPRCMIPNRAHPQPMVSILDRLHPSDWLLACNSTATLIKRATPFPALAYRHCVAAAIPTIAVPTHCRCCRRRPAPARFLCLRPGQRDPRRGPGSATIKRK